MATAEATPIERGRQLSLPNFRQFKIRQTRIAFGGALELALTSPEDVALVNALELGAEGTVTLRIDGLDREVVLDCWSAGENHKFRKTDDRDDVVKVVKVSIGGLHGADDEPGEDD